MGLWDIHPLVVSLVVILPLLGRLVMRLDAVPHAVFVTISTMRDVASSSHSQKCAAEDAQLVGHFRWFLIDLPGLNHDWNCYNHQTMPNAFILLAILWID